jgi:hypothetical protein
MLQRSRTYVLPQLRGTAHVMRRSRVTISAGATFAFASAVQPLLIEEVAFEHDTNETALPRHVHPGVHVNTVQHGVRGSADVKYAYTHTYTHSLTTVVRQHRAIFRGV